MKKYTWILVALVMVIALSSCTVHVGDFKTEYASMINKLDLCDTVSTYVSSKMYRRYEKSRGISYSLSENYTYGFLVKKNPMYISTINAEDVVEIYEEKENKLYKTVRYPSLPEFTRELSDDFSIEDDIPFLSLCDNYLGIEVRTLRKSDNKYVVKGMYNDIVELDGYITDLMIDFFPTKISRFEQAEAKIEFNINDDFVYVKAVFDMPNDSCAVQIDIITEKASSELTEPISHDFVGIDRYAKKTSSNELKFGGIYYMKLDKGIYAFETSNSSFTYSVYNSGVSIGLGQYEPIPSMGGTFTVTKAGYYYISSDVNTTAKLVKMNFDSASVSEIVESTKYDGSLKGAYDYDKYIFNSDYNGVYEIISKSNQSISVIFGSDDQREIMTFNDSQYFKLNRGENVFYVFTNKDQGSNYKYSFEIKTYESEGSEFGSDNYITDTPSEEVYFVGVGTPDLYFKLDVTSHSFYGFYFEKTNLAQSDNVQFDLFRNNGQFVCTLADGDMNLITKGEYYVRVTCPKDEIAIGKYYYKVSALN